LRDAQCRVEPTGVGLAVAINDLTFEHKSDPAELATFWALATPRLVLSVRRHPLKSADKLRSAVRGALSVESGIELVAQLFELRTHDLQAVLEGMTEEVNNIEDQILGGRVTEQREQLGRIRRSCTVARACGVNSCPRGWHSRSSSGIRQRGWKSMT
jgi:zinc transporter